MESPAVAKLGFELAGEAEQDVSLLAPVIGAVAGRVLDHANADRSKLSGAPQGGARFAGMFRGRDCGPVGSSKWDLADLHDDVEGPMRDGLTADATLRWTEAACAASPHRRTRSDFGQFDQWADLVKAKEHCADARDEQSETSMSHEEPPVPVPAAASGHALS